MMDEDEITTDEDEIVIEELDMLSSDELLDTITSEDKGISEEDASMEEDAPIEEDVPSEEYSTAAIPPQFPHPISKNAKSIKAIFFIVYLLKEKARYQIDTWPGVLSITACRTSFQIGHTML